jgi:hypothetical protein
MTTEITKEIPGGSGCFRDDGKKCDCLIYESWDCGDAYYCNINASTRDPMADANGPEFLALVGRELCGHTSEDRRCWRLDKDPACLARFPEGTTLHILTTIFAEGEKQERT